MASKRVGADDDIDPPARHVRLHLLGALGGHEARQLLDPDRQSGETFGEAAVMLARQQRGRHHHRHLGSRHHRGEGRAQRHLGLAEADVAADEPVGRPPRRQIAERVADRLLLVLGLGIGKARGEFVVHPLGRRHRLAFAQLPLGRDFDELAGDVADARLDPRLARLPGDAAEAVELHRRVLRAEARQHLDVLDRHEQLVVAGINHPQAIVRRPCNFKRHQPVITADAVLFMHHQIAGIERRDLGDEMIEIGPPPRRARKPVAENVLLGDERRACRDIALLQRQHRQARRGFGQGLERGPIRH